jgi:phosphatidate cytidylyltransferase
VAFTSFAVAITPAIVARLEPSMNPFAPQAVVVFSFMVLTFLLAMRSEDLAAGAKAVIGGTFAVVYVGFSLSFLVRLRDFPGQGIGEALMMFAVGCAKFGDIGAYFAGKTFGRTPLSPKVSPKKTVEGALGAIGGSIAAAFVIWWLFGNDIAKAPAWANSLISLAGFAVILSIVAQFGDLAESLLKRAGGIKDSGGAFAAMGGVLDMTDSLLFAAPVAYILALLGGYRAG